MKSIGTINTKSDGDKLFVVEITPKGESEMVELTVYAKNSLDASNYLIRNKIWGEQHDIYPHSSNLLH